MTLIKKGNKICFSLIRLNEDLIIDLSLLLTDLYYHIYYAIFLPPKYHLMGLFKNLDVNAPVVFLPINSDHKCISFCHGDDIFHLFNDSRFIGN